MKRRLEFGWLRTINALWEKTFPLLIKNVSPAEVAAVFPLALLGILLSHHGYLVEIPIIGLIALFLFYEEKSMDIYHYLLYFILFYIKKTPMEKRPSTSRKSENIPINKLVNIVKKYIVIAKKYVVFSTALLLLAIVEQIILRIAISSYTSTGVILFVAGTVFIALAIAYVVIRTVAK